MDTAKRVPACLLPHRSGLGEPVRDRGCSSFRSWTVASSELEPEGARVLAGPSGCRFCRALGGGLFELRVSLASGGSRARVIVCVHEEELYALHAFIKKTRKTPESDLKLARRRKHQLERAK